MTWYILNGVHYSFVFNFIIIIIFCYVAILIFIAFYVVLIIFVLIFNLIYVYFISVFVFSYFNFKFSLVLSYYIQADFFFISITRNVFLLIFVAQP